MAYITPTYLWYKIRRAGAQHYIQQFVLILHSTWLHNTSYICMISPKLKYSIIVESIALHSRQNMFKIKHTTTKTTC